MSALGERYFRSRRVVTAAGVAPASIEVRGGRIVALRAWSAVPPGAPLVDGGDLAILPGVVDSHVHVNEPGRTEWEGMVSATRAAAAGGITTVVDMPLNSIPPATSRRGLLEKAALAEGRCQVDLGLWGGAVPETCGGDGALEALLESGALGFKCFLVPSGVDEFPSLGEVEVRRALDELHGQGAAFMVHAELPGPIDAAAQLLAAERPPADPRAYATYLRSRPPSAEDEAVALLYRLCKESGTPVHVVHLASASALPILARARDEGLPLTAETAPHYLHFAAEAVPDGATVFKCAPPIRGQDNRERLLAALDEGLITMVVSDHSPCTPELKCPERGDFLAAWGGIAGLQLSLPTVWTEVSARGLGLGRLAEWMCAAPARHAGLAGSKGALLPEHDADLVLFDPDAYFTVEGAALFHRHRPTPYLGERLRGVVRATYLRGELAYEEGRPFPPPRGRWIPRS